MLYFNRFQVCPWLAFLFSATATIPVKDTKRKLPKFIQYIPQLISALFIVALWCLVARISLSRPENIHLYSPILAIMLPNIVMIFICIFRKIAIETIYRSFGNAFKRIEALLEVPIEVSLYKQSLIQKYTKNFALLSIIAMYKVLSYTVFKAKYVTQFADILDFLFLIQSVYKLVAALSVVSLIYSIEFSLMIVNEKLRSIPSDLSLYLSKSNILKLLEVLRNIKVIHFHLHSVSIVISLTFGWFAILTFLSSFLVTVANAFWLYTYVASTTDLNILIIIRKY